MSRVERAVARNAYGSFERVNGANRLLAALTQNSQQTNGYQQIIFAGGCLMASPADKSYQPSVT